MLISKSLIFQNLILTLDNNTLLRRTKSPSCLILNFQPNLPNRWFQVESIDNNWAKLEMVSELVKIDRLSIAKA